MTTLLCTVRGCGQPLERLERSFVCANRHSFDVSRSGYVNLLQPQDRRSSAPGDSRDAVEARRRFLLRGLDAPIVRQIVDAFPLTPRASLLDVGCGEGHYLAAFRASYEIETWGVDISTPAIELAARSDSRTRWIIANADRWLPFADGSFDALASITARLTPEEFRRVLKQDGRLLLVVAAADDLIELREAVQGARVETPRVDRTLEQFSDRFVLLEQKRVAVCATLEPDAIADLLASTYRGLRHREQARLASITTLDVTLSRDVLVMAPLSA